MKTTVEERGLAEGLTKHVTILPYQISPATTHPSLPDWFQGLSRGWGTPTYCASSMFLPGIAFDLIINIFLNVFVEEQKVLRVRT